ncbi:16308_t:CDS:1, partial [Acaulospora colombiana]
MKSSRTTDVPRTLFERLKAVEGQMLKLEEEISSVKKMMKFNFINERILSIVMRRSTTEEEVLKLRRLYRLINDNQVDPEFIENWSENLMSWLKSLELSYEKGTEKCSFNCQLWENIRLLLELYEESLPSADIVSTSPRLYFLRILLKFFPTFHPTPEFLYSLKQIFLISLSNSVPQIA